MNLRPVLIGTVTALAVAAAILGCPPGIGAQVNAADAIAEDWTNAICTVAEGQPAGQPFVDLICQGVLIVEGTVSTLTADGGPLAAATPQKTATVFLRHVPADQAAQYLQRFAAKRR